MCGLTEHLFLGQFKRKKVIWGETWHLFLRKGVQLDKLRAGVVGNCSPGNLTTSNDGDEVPK